MAYLKKYEYDVFISYCHRDNLKQFDEELGWVDNFYQNLKTSLLKLTGARGSRTPVIWWDDKRIDGNTLFDDSIADALKNSAILICLNSPSYLNSDYCKQELDLFYKHFKDKTPGINVGDRSRILNVLLYNIPHKEWPPEFGGTSGFHFHNSLEEGEEGHPLTIRDEQFKDTFLSFCDSVKKLIEAFSEPEPPPPAKFDVFFGDVSDNLRRLQKRTITEVAKETITEKNKDKFEIIQGIPPPYEKDEHEVLVNGQLETAEASVHLLDAVPGRNIEEEDSLCYPQKQAELSLLTTIPKFIWIPPDLNIKTVEDEKYRNFLQGLEDGNLGPTKYKFVRSPRGEVMQQVIDMVKDVYGRWPGRDGKTKVLLDTHYNDQLYALELYTKLVDDFTQPLLNSDEGDPLKNESILEERIRQATYLFFFYGKISRDWVSERLNAALQLVVEKEYPVQEFFVLMLPPHKDPASLTLPQSPVKITILNNSDSQQLDMNLLQPVIDRIKGLHHDSYSSK